MGECTICHRCTDRISDTLGLCAGCILTDTPVARSQAAAANARSRLRFTLPSHPPRNRQGARCGRCVNTCNLDTGHVGYCGVRRNDDGQFRGGNAESAAVQWYHNPLPTNCVADWVCPASGPAGFPDFTDATGPEYGYSNLAVFYEACSFDCLFCQNWHFRAHSVAGPTRSRLRGLIDVSKRYLMYVAGRNLGVIMRAIFGIGTPKSLQTEGEASPWAVFAWLAVVRTGLRRLYDVSVIHVTDRPARTPSTSVTYAA